MRNSKRNIIWVSLCLLLISACEESLSDKEPEADTAISSEIAKMTSNNPAYIPPEDCPDHLKAKPEKYLDIKIENIMVSLERNGLSPKQFKVEQSKFLTKETLTLSFGESNKNEIKLLGTEKNNEPITNIQLWFYGKGLRDSPENKIVIKSIIEAIDPSVDSVKILRQLSSESLDQIKITNYTSRVCEIVNNIYIEYIETPEKYDDSLTIFFSKK